MIKSKREMSYAMCYRCSDLPHPWVDSEKRKCINCGEDCWVAHSTIRAMEMEKKDLSIYCSHCVSEIAGEHDVEIVGILPEQTKDILKHFRGYDG